MNEIALETHPILAHPYVRDMNAHFAQIADCAARVGHVQLLGDVERRQLGPCKQERKDAVLVGVEEKFLTFVKNSSICSRVLALSAGGDLFCIHLPAHY